MKENREKAKAFRLSKYRADPAHASIKYELGDTSVSYAHGRATVCGRVVDAYFDLGGVHILMSDDDYEAICKEVRGGQLPDTRTLTMAEVGCGPRGVPVDLACSTNGGSSIVWVNRWIKTTVRIVTKTGRTHVLTQQVIGFVKRSAPLLIIGQKGCTLCGYRTIEQQDADHEDRDRAKSGAHETTRNTSGMKGADTGVGGADASHAYMSATGKGPADSTTNVKEGTVGDDGDPVTTPVTCAESRPQSTAELAEDTTSMMPARVYAAAGTSPLMISSTVVSDGRMYVGKEAPTA